MFMQKNCVTHTIASYMHFSNMQIIIIACCFKSRNYFFFIYFYSLTKVTVEIFRWTITRWCTN